MGNLLRIFDDRLKNGLKNSHFSARYHKYLANYSRKIKNN